MLNLNGGGSGTLAIDLSGLRTNNGNGQQNQQQQKQALPPEYQYRMIYYCDKCPARYAQKHNNPDSGKIDLEEHLKGHETTKLASTPSEEVSNQRYQCDFCDFGAMEQCVVQAHRLVHSMDYQEKCNELFRNCKEDTVFKAPKLTTIRNAASNETIWIVEKCAKALKQLTSSLPLRGTVNVPINYDVGGNSLLKKQLELPQSPSSATMAMTLATTASLPQSSQQPQQEEDKNNNKLNDLQDSQDQLEKESKSQNAEEVHCLTTSHDETVANDVDTNLSVKERCDHCPYESDNVTEYKKHLQRHICISQKKLKYTCDHCDYTADEIYSIDDHVRIHFNVIERLKNIEFFTSYDKLELSTVKLENETDESLEKKEDILKDVEMQEAINQEQIKEEVENSVENNNTDNKIEEKNTNKDDVGIEEIPAEFEKKEPKCNKIILYKSDGCLATKIEGEETINGNTTEKEEEEKIVEEKESSNTIGDNVCDRRLRKRNNRCIGDSTLSNTNTNSTVTANGNTGNEEPIVEEENNSNNSVYSNRKTLLVNAKTGQKLAGINYFN